MPYGPAKLHADRPAARSIATRPTSRQRGYNYRWEKLSARFVAAYPFCVHCLCKKRVNAGATRRPSARGRQLVCDHIVPHRGNRSLLFDHHNLETLCKVPCHDSAKQRVESMGTHSIRHTWFEYLRQLISEHDASDHIAAHADRIPPGVLNELAGPHRPRPSPSSTPGGGLPRGGEASQGLLDLYPG